MSQQGLLDFFAFARERHSIYLRRMALKPRPWTEDPVLGYFRFTNVYRELDRVTVHLRSTVRPNYSGAKLLLATVVYRWFNRPEIGEAIFGKSFAGVTPFEHFFLTGETDLMRKSILLAAPKGPWVTGAYIIKGKDGMNKLDGVLWCLEKFWSTPMLFRTESVGEITWREVGEILEADVTHDETVIRMEDVWRWFRQYPYSGDFIAYEVVCDLRHGPNALLGRAPDIRSWANPGPGAQRGLNRLHRRPHNLSVPKAALIQEMRDVLAASPAHWLPTEEFPLESDWPAWEMREVEHTLCEFDKFRRTHEGQGRPRGVYR